MKEALLAARDALENSLPVGTDPTAITERHNKALALIDTALAQTEQEPVATKNKDGITLHFGWDDLPEGTKLYAAPVAQTDVVKDAERLDWLDKYAHIATWVDHEPTKLVIDASSGDEFTGDTWRECIDAAIAAAQKGVDQ